MSSDAVARLYVSKRNEVCLFGRKPRIVDPSWLAMDRDSGLYGITPPAVPVIIDALRKEGVPVDVSPEADAWGRRALVLANATRAVHEGRVTLPNGALANGESLREYQRRTLAFADATMGRFLLGDEVGLGKTPQIIGVSRHLSCERTLVITKASVKYKWAAEVERFDGRPALVLEGERSRSIFPQTAYVIANYDILAAWEKPLAAWDPEFVVADEFHKMANPDAQMSRVAKRMMVKAPYAAGLTGTPVRDRPRDLWNLLDSLWPGWWGSRWDFERVWCKGRKKPVSRMVKGKRKTWLIWSADGVSNEESLAHRLETILLRRLKKEVEKDLPESTRFTYPAALSDAARAEYDRLSEQMAKALESKKHQDVLALLTRLRQTSSIGRVSATVDYAQKLLANEPERPVVVFAYFLESMNLLQDQLKDYRVARIDGSTSPAQRKVINDAFQDGKLDILIGQVVAAGEGIDLFRSDTTLHHDVTWSPFEQIQAEGRINRIGQTRPMSHVYFLGKGTVDERVLDITMRKLAMSTSLLDAGGAKVDRELIASLKAEYFHQPDQKKLRA